MSSKTTKTGGTTTKTSVGESKEDREFDKNFVAPVATKVLTAERPGSRIVTKLYGVVTAERVEREQRECDRRAEQLAPQPKRVERIERVPSQYIGDDEAQDIKRRRVR
jgi:hypothetical protein